MIEKKRLRGRPPGQHQAYCKRGHLMAGDNLYISPQGARQCKACVKLIQQRHSQATKEEPRIKKQRQRVELARLKRYFEEAL